MSLRARIGLLVGVVTVVLATLTSVVVVRQNWQRGESAINDEVIAELDRQDRATAAQFDSQRELRLEEPSRGGVALFDQLGELVEIRGDLTEQDAIKFAEEFEADTFQEFDLLVDDSFDGERVVGVTGCIEQLACGSIIATRSPTSFASYFAARVFWLMLIIGAISAATVLAARFVVIGALRPVDHMREELDDITAADLTRRVPVPETGDELAALGNSLNQTIGRLETGVETQRRFAADAAHELRSPLAGIKATLEVAARGPADATESIERAIGQTDRAADLVADLLLLARSGGAPPTENFRLCDIDDVTRTVVASVQNGHPEITFDRSAVAPVQTSAHPEAISRVVRNLVENAAAHASSQVVVTLVDERSSWKLSVDDDGPGIPTAERHHVFERFVRLDQSRSRDTGGSGLGLAIVHEIVTSHGGAVQATASPLGGARLEVRVPTSL